MKEMHCGKIENEIENGKQQTESAAPEIMECRREKKGLRKAAGPLIAVCAFAAAFFWVLSTSGYL